VIIWMSVINPGWCYELRLKGYPLVSAVKPVGTDTLVSGGVTSRD
jgi:hypothetical protein